MYICIYHRITRHVIILTNPIANYHQSSSSGMGGVLMRGGGPGGSGLIFFFGIEMKLEKKIYWNYAR